MSQDTDIVDVVKTLEELQWKLHLDKKSGKVSKEYFDGYSICLFVLKRTLHKKNIHYSV